MRRYAPTLFYAVVVIAYFAWTFATPGIDHLAGKAVLMPALLAAVLAIGLGTAPGIVGSWRSVVAFVLLCIGIAASFVGDVAMGHAMQLGLVGLGLAHASYIALYAWPARTGRPSWWTFVYPIGYALTMWLLWSDLGAMAAAISAYGVVLAAGAVFATGVNALTAIGGALFYVADAGIAIRWFAPHALAFFPDPWQDATLMLLYCVAQGCIAFGVLRRLEAEPALATERRLEAAKRRRGTYRPGYEPRSGELV